VTLSHAHSSGLTVRWHRRRHGSAGVRSRDGRSTSPSSRGHRSSSAPHRPDGQRLGHGVRPTRAIGVWDLTSRLRHDPQGEGTGVILTTTWCFRGDRSQHRPDSVGSATDGRNRPRAQPRPHNASRSQGIRIRFATSSSPLPASRPAHPIPPPPRPSMPASLARA
jgi:hypothetical protein